MAWYVGGWRMGKNNKQLIEWMSYYEHKTGEPFKGWTGANFIFNEEYGFCVYIQDGTTLIIGEVCGDGWHWCSHLNNKAKELGCNKLRFWTKRNPAAFARKFGFVLTGFLDDHHILEKEVVGWAE
jgi:hypothetical protein